MRRKPKKYTLMSFEPERKATFDLFKTEPLPIKLNLKSTPEALALLQESGLEYFRTNYKSVTVTSTWIDWDKEINGNVYPPPCVDAVFLETGHWIPLYCLEYDNIPSEEWEIDG